LRSSGKLAGCWQAPVWPGNDGDPGHDATDVLRFLIHFQHMETNFVFECAEGDAKAGDYQDWHRFAVERANVLDLHSALGRLLAIHASKPPAPVRRITPFDIDIERWIDTEQRTMSMSPPT
jgi:hypothetical protein